MASMAATGSAWACTCGKPLESSISQASYCRKLVAHVTVIGTEYVPAPYCDKHRAADCDPREVDIITIGEILKGSQDTDSNPCRRHAALHGRDDDALRRRSIKTIHFDVVR
jgi:hypothetical protein